MNTSYAHAPQPQPQPQVVSQFWFEQATPEQWFKTDPAFDALVATRFGALWRQAIAGELFEWRDTSLGRLAEIIVLDQFSRNIHRGSPEAFAQDAMALALAQEAVRAGALDDLSEPQRNFLLLPYMHSESAKVHDVAQILFKNYSSSTTQDFEWRHKAIIDRFGRYPHRNQVLGRVSTPQEVEFLKQPGSGF